MKYLKLFFDDNKKLILGLIIVLVVVFIFDIIVNNDFVSENRIEKYIISKGFKLDKDKIMYEKVISDNTYNKYLNDKNNKVNSKYDVLIFDIYSSQLLENVYDYTDGVSSFLSAAYSYKDGKLIYNYRVTYENSNVVYMGSYNKNKFICDNEYSYGLSDNTDDVVYCELIKNYIDNFKDIAIETITSTKILNDMKK